MGNPFYNAPGGSPGGNPMGNFAQMVKNFNQFRSSFSGDPRAKVQELMDSGQMSQEQFNKLSNMAKQYASLFGMK